MIPHIIAQLLVWKQLFHKRLYFLNHRRVGFFHGNVRNPRTFMRIIFWKTVTKRIHGKVNHPIRKTQQMILTIQQVHEITHVEDVATIHHDFVRILLQHVDHNTVNFILFFLERLIPLIVGRSRQPIHQLTYQMQLFCENTVESLNVRDLLSQLCT